MITDFYEEFVFVNKTITDDGYGGFEVEYIEGDSFFAGISTNTSIEARIAEKLGVTSLYTISTNKNTDLKFDNIVKSRKTGNVYRIKSDPNDMIIPDVSSLDIKQASAERFTIPID